MEFLTSLWTFMTKHGGVVLAAFFGGLVSTKFSEGLTLKSGMVNIGFGMIMAQFLSYPIARRYEIEEYVLSIAFLVGLFGLSACAAINRFWKEADLWALIKSKIESWGSK
jgi:hypothetical protein